MPDTATASNSPVMNGAAQRHTMRLFSGTSSCLACCLGTWLFVRDQWRRVAGPSYQLQLEDPGRWTTGCG